MYILVIWIKFYNVGGKSIQKVLSVVQCHLCKLKIYTYTKELSVLEWKLEKKKLNPYFYLNNNKLQQQNMGQVSLSKERNFKVSSKTKMNIADNQDLQYWLNTLVVSALLHYRKLVLHQLARGWCWLGSCGRARGPAYSPPTTQGWVRVC